VGEPAVRRKRRRHGFLLTLLPRVGGQLLRYLAVVRWAVQRRIRFPRPGDRVEVEGSPALLRFRDYRGVWRGLPPIVVERLRELSRGGALGRPTIESGPLGKVPEVSLAGKWSVIAAWRTAAMDGTDEGGPPEYMAVGVTTLAGGQTARHRSLVWSSEPLCLRKVPGMERAALVKVKGRQQLWEIRDVDLPNVDVAPPWLRPLDRRPPAPH
jgi:hypothetical protein